jgi:hypothetical protein
MRLSFEAVEEQVSLENLGSELTRERLANSVETSSSPMHPRMQNGEHWACRHGSMKPPQFIEEAIPSGLDFRTLKADIPWTKYSKFQQ